MPHTTAPVVWISTLIRLFLAGVFLVAGALKVLDLEGSVQAVRAYELLPEWLNGVVGWGLPFVEIVVGLLLAAGLLTRAVALASSALQLIFLTALISALARGLSIDCGCFGGGGAVAQGDTSYPIEIARSACFLALAVWLAWRPITRLSLDRYWQEPQ